MSQQIPRPAEFEHLGAFYLGRAHDLARDRQLPELVLYDSADLTTHAVIIGMTGSGKTGLGVSLIEEAAIDRVPTIVIDPKGDMANLLLTFPELAPADFEPWVDPRRAQAAGQDVGAFARSQAALWRKGLASWGQDGERIRMMREAVELALYTPGSTAGRPISLLSSFDAPPPSLLADADAYRERLQATATSVLALLGEDGDPLTSREHILLTAILDHSWSRGLSLDLAGLIAQVQRPPVERLGVFAIDEFFPATDRFKLAMALNNLLASPTFGAWLEGEPLSAERLLYAPGGKPRVSVLSIAHLDDQQRMFFVTLLLAELIGWMRDQPGTGSLRALLYMDELFGFLPPTANPPSKTLFLTLLKQARAFGLGLVLSTQNPVDLDYKALSNAGTWFIGRLQTERDKARVMEGLEGAAAGGSFDRGKMEQTLAGLGKRKFLLHNVHEQRPVVFGTRWAMSYLAGPMTREQLRRLTPDVADAAPGEASGTPAALERQLAHAAPALPPSIPQRYLPHRGDGEVCYHPRLLGGARLVYSNRTYKVEEETELVRWLEVDDGGLDPDWRDAEAAAFSLDQLREEPGQGRFAACPAPLTRARAYKGFASDFKRYLRNDCALELLRCPRYKLISRAGEPEGPFRARLQQAAKEARDVAVGKLRQRYSDKVTRIEERIRKAEQRLEREQAQKRGSMWVAAVSVGTALLGGFLGRKRVSVSNVARAGSAVRKAGRVSKESGDVDRAKDDIKALEAQLVELENELKAELATLDRDTDAQALELDALKVRAKSTDIDIQLIALVWAPYRQDLSGRWQPAWS